MRHHVAMLRLLCALLGCGAAHAGELTGRVFVDEKPVAGIAVSAVPYETPFEQARREARRGAAPQALAGVKTGTDGAFRLSVSAPRGQPPAMFRLRFEGPAVVASMLPEVYDTLGAEDAGDVPLVAGRVLAGRVTDAAGKPLAGAVVRLGGWDDAAAAPVATRADGSFQIAGARERRNGLAVEAAGYAPVALANVSAGALPKPIVLAAGALVEGVVRRSDGKAPAAGALVRVEGAASTRWVETGADGRFRIPHAPAGKGTLVADGGDGTLAERHLGLPLAAASKLTLVLAPAAALGGRVVDARTGQAVPRTRLTLATSVGVRTGRSGPDGAYEFEGLRAGGASLIANEPRYVERLSAVALRAGERRREDVALVAGTTLTGRVTDEDGAPVAGARGVLSKSGDPGFSSPMRAWPEVAFRTAVDGTFKAARLEPGANQRLTVTRADFEPQVLGGLRLEPGTTRALAIVLRRGLTLTGSVSDSEGRPVAGVELRLQLMPGMGRGARFVFAGAFDQAPQSESAADGSFSLNGVGPGEYQLAARKAGYADAHLPLKLVEGEAPAPVRVTLEAGAAISGRVVHPDGQGAEGWYVHARGRGAPLGLFGMRNPPEPTGPDGGFVIGGLRRGGVYDLQFSGPDGSGPRRAGIEAPADGIEITLPGRGRITGRALDAQTGQPIADYTASYERDGMGPGRMVVLRGGMRDRDAGVAPADGGDGSYLLENVPAGTWNVKIDAPGYQTGRAAGVVVTAGATTEGVDVRLSRASTLSGRVTDARTGRPVLDAEVSAGAATGDGGARFSWNDQGPSATTDADGRFEIGGLAPGRYTLTGRHPDYSEAIEAVEVRGAGAQADLRLQAGGVVAGTVSSQGRPLAGAEVTLAPAGAGRFGGDAGGYALSDEAGQFRLEHLAAGRFTLSAALRGHASAPVEVALQPGEVREGIALSLAAGAAIHGLVTGLPDDERAGVMVTAGGPQGYSAMSLVDAEGRFELSGAPVGAVDVRGRAGDLMGSMRSASAQVTIAEGQTEAQVELAFQTGLTLSGQVTRAGAPVADASVGASRRGGGSYASGRAGASGDYRIEGLLAGTYNVNARTFDGEAGVSRTIEITGDTTLDLDLPSARIAGSVLEAGSRLPLGDAQVEATAAGGRSRHAATDSNGRFAIESLEPGAYTASFSRNGYRVEKRELAAAEPGADDVVVELTRAEGIGIEARDGIYGFPLRQLMARATDAQGTAVFTGSISLDGNGRGEIPSLHPGRYVLRLDAGGYAPRLLEALDVPAPTLSVMLTPGGNLEIGVASDLLANGPLRARILKPSGAPYMPSSFAPDGAFSIVREVSTLRNLVPGSYSLVVDGQQAKPFTIEEGGSRVVAVP